MKIHLPLIFSAGKRLSMAPITMARYFVGQKLGKARTDHGNKFSGQRHISSHAYQCPYLVGTGTWTMCHRKNSSRPPGLVGYPTLGLSRSDAQLNMQFFISLLCTQANISHVDTFCDLVKGGMVESSLNCDKDNKL